MIYKFRAKFGEGENYLTKIVAFRNIVKGYINVVAILPA